MALQSREDYERLNEHFPRSFVGHFRWDQEEEASCVMQLAISKLHGGGDFTGSLIYIGAAIPGTAAMDTYCAINGKLDQESGHIEFTEIEDDCVSQYSGMLSQDGKSLRLHCVNSDQESGCLDMRVDMGILDASWFDSADQG